MPTQFNFNPKKHMCNETNNTCDCKKMAHKIGGGIICLTILCLAIFLAFEARNTLKEYNYIGKSAQTTNAITITGEGKITAAPNIATVQIGTVTMKATVAESQKENTKKMNDLIAAVKKEGIEDKDIKTSDY